MTHALALRVLGCPEPVEISPAEFNALKAARTTLLTALGAEEKYDLVIDNYAEYERELLGLVIEKMLHHEFQWTVFAVDRYLIARRLANALTVSRSYADQIKQDVRVICGSEAPQAALLDACFSAEYDQSMGYRVMEALRNYLQHGGFPIALSYSSAWDEPRVWLKFRILPTLDLQALAGSTFKSTIYQELLTFASKGAKTNISLWLREYVEGIIRIHGQFRELVAEHVETSRSEFERTISRARECFGEKIKSLAAVSFDDAGEQEEVLPLFDDILERLGVLRKRNPILPTLSRWYVSGDARSS